MKLLVISDTHFEFMRDAGRTLMEEVSKDADVAIVAGDLCTFPGIPDAVALLSQTFAQTVIVNGNHESYGNSIERALAVTRNECRRAGNVHLLDGELELLGQRFVGGTLWFPYDERVTYPDDENCMADFAYIAELRRNVGPANRGCAEFLRANTRASDVVVTHHLPSARSVAPMFAASRLNKYFVGEIGDVIDSAQPKLAVHGHTHVSCDYMQGATRVVANPFGYVGQENPRFDPGFIVQV